MPSFWGQTGVSGHFLLCRAQRTCPFANQQNTVILPISSERQLRELLVSSLQRVATLSHLIAKVRHYALLLASLRTDYRQTYVLDISDEEKEVRDLLNQSIRQDFAFLSQKLNETSLEVSPCCATRVASNVLTDKPQGQLDAMERDRLLQDGSLSEANAAGKLSATVPERKLILSQGDDNRILLTHIYGAVRP